MGGIILITCYAVFELHKLFNESFVHVDKEAKKKKDVAARRSRKLSPYGVTKHFGASVGL
jgi:hypothetical protein